MGVMDRLYSQAKRRQATIILPEPEDPRVLDAAAIIERKGYANLILIGEEKRVRQLLAKKRLKLKAQILDYATYPKAEHLAREMVMLRRHKGLVLDEARSLLSKDTKYFAAMLVHQGVADGYVSGSSSPSANTMRPALQIIKTHTGYASSHFLMIHKGKPLIFADCAFNISPTAEQLALIAEESVASAKLYGIQPRVAFLNFSTKGSSGHVTSVRRIEHAVALAKAKLKCPVDGELQFDAAFVPEVAKLKAKGSNVAGKATIFIFPDLDSGNIGYKIAQRMGCCQAIGPILQGLKKPANDLSRGCSVQDIVDVVAVTACQAPK